MRQGLSVLVVDDEQPLRKVLQTSLTARGFSVEEAGSAERAMEIVAQRSFDLLLLDINMPGISGIEACQRIRARKPHLGIVMVTVRDSEGDIVQALEAGADDYVTKPFRLEELIARLRAVVRRTATENAGVTVIRAGDLEIDFEKRVLKRAGEVIHLTPTEFDLLALLVKNRGVLLTHTKLLRTIWGPQHGQQLEYLRTYVRTLRKKIEDDPAQPKYILTEPWIGYRFHSPSEIDSVPQDAE